MIWTNLHIAFIIFLTAWMLGIIALFVSKGNPKAQVFANFSPAIANATLLLFIVLLWIQIERPPLKTMAETRLWYAFFVSLITWIIYLRTKVKSLYLLGFIMASVFLIVDIIHPEYQNKNLMPALQSPWFIPHVVIYMIAYAVLAAACLTAIIGLLESRKTGHIAQSKIILTMKLVYPGFALLSIGMIFGALWAKIAWGNYWSWDPKETWALLTWLFYLLCIHLFHAYPKRKKLLILLLAFSFIVLIITWMGIRYFPSGMDSVHVYG